jgi:potassium channel subfamily K, invertebrate
LCSIGYATIGIPIFLLCVANISGVLGEMFRFIYGKIICRPCRIIKKRRAAARKAKLEEDSLANVEQVPTNGWSTESDVNRKSIKKPENAMLANAAVDDGEDQARNERVAVPLTVTMIIIAGYIWIGSALFHNFEGWSMIQAGYFCFITLGKRNHLRQTFTLSISFSF